ncbi:MAG: Asp-tRNA(Asn)/Glu-tRNA(Gln) amidotransferase subunit GatB [Candidatus Harrisonbacteria bacterium]|nr:Asp-tRNA(Asn)/Glu-tRNA(Gln) amidotransferase subunit GatB [Candidatus Harrisonbacteria bacterium]
MKYMPTIGLEIHSELKTATKMFCDCPNDPDEKHPNTNVCPICLGHPGVLPTINKKAVESIIKIGFTVSGKINENFKFDRKNYFYPDLPKGYQISQYDLPIVKGGSLDISDRLGMTKIVYLDRVHLEEDAARLVHGGSPSTRASTELSRMSSGQQASLVDFNRGGVPLMELVTEPNMHTAEEAVAFAKELQLILRYLEVSDADLERGQMRFDANISLTNDQQPTTNDKLGTKVEIKNLNSFAALEQAIQHEIERQTEVLESSKFVKQETRGWDDVKKKTVSQRSKEEAHDYRYFPEPDLPPLEASAFDLASLKLAVPELPKEKRQRFKEQLGLNFEQADLLAEDRQAAAYFEEAISELEADSGLSAGKEKIQLAFNYLTSDLRGLMKEYELSFESLKITPENFGDLIEMISKKEISSRTAKDLLVKMLEGVDPRTLVENEGLAQVSEESALLETIKKVISENPAAVADYKKGKSNALQFLVGKAMAELGGRGNPSVLKSLFEKELE